MANAKIIEKKALVVDEIKGKFENAKSVVVFDPRGLSVAEVTELRRALRESGSDYKVYKNTLAKRAANTLDIKLDEYLEGPSAISFSSDELAPVKVISDFAKKHTLDQVNDYIAQNEQDFISFIILLIFKIYSISKIRSSAFFKLNVVWQTK